MAEGTPAVTFDRKTSYGHRMVEKLDPWVLPWPRPRQLTLADSGRVLRWRGATPAQSPVLKKLRSLKARSQDRSRVRSWSTIERSSVLLGAWYAEAAPSERLPSRPGIAAPPRVRGALLSEFLNLGPQPEPAAVLAFAKRWGVLDGEVRGPREEPLRWWTDTIALFKALLVLVRNEGVRKDGGSPAQVAALEVMDQASGQLRPKLHLPPRLAAFIHFQAIGVRSPSGSLASSPAGMLEQVARACGVGPVLVDDENGGFVPYAGGGSLLGALAVDLVRVTSKPRDFALCPQCELLFQPKRRPPLGERAWCPECRERGASRHAADRARRDRERHTGA